MRLTRRAGLHLAAAGSAITLITMIGSVPVSAALGGKPGPGGLLPALRGVHHGTSVEPGGESEEIIDRAGQFAAVRTAPPTHVRPPPSSPPPPPPPPLAHPPTR